MNMALRFFIALALLLFCVSGGVTQARSRLQVVATTQDLADIAREVGGDLVEATAIARGYQDPHQVETKPSYILKLQKADLFVELGLDMEVAWAPSLLESSRNGRIQKGSPGFVDAYQGVSIMEVPTRRVSRAEGDIHPFGNPHYHLDPANGIIIARNIASGLKRVDPANASTYDARYMEYARRVKAAVEKWVREMAPFRGTKVVTYHRSWPYFARRFGLVVVENVEPRPGIPPSAAHTSRVIQAIKAQKIKVLMMEPYFSRDVPDAIARETGVKVVVMCPSTGGLPGVDSYLDVFEKNVQLLLQAVK